MKFGKKILTVGLSIALLSGSYLNANALNSIYEIQGKDRYETAALIADKFAEKEQYKTAILVNSDKNLSDGLSASGLAGVEDAPILLVKNSEIPKVTLEKLNGLKYVYIIGGYNSVGQLVEDKLNEMNIDVVRVSGEDRIDTSLKVAKLIEKYKMVSKVILTNAYKDADAMSIASVAFRDKMPIILTNGKTTEYDTTDKQAYTIGGSDSMSDDIIKTDEVRIGGKDRFETNKMIIKEFYYGINEFYITKAYNLVDSLTGSALAKEKPIVLVHNGSDKSILKNATNVTTLGGIDKTILTECLNVTNGIGDPNTGVKDKLEVAKELAKEWYQAKNISDTGSIPNDGKNVILVNKDFVYNNKNFDNNDDPEYYYGSPKLNNKKFYCFGFASFGTKAPNLLCISKDNLNDAYICYTETGHMQKISINKGQTNNSSYSDSLVLKDVKGMWKNRSYNDEEDAISKIQVDDEYIHIYYKDGNVETSKYDITEVNDKTRRFEFKTYYNGDEYDEYAYDEPMMNMMVINKDTTGKDELLIYTYYGFSGHYSMWTDLNLYK